MLLFLLMQIYFIHHQKVKCLKTHGWKHQNMFIKEHYPLKMPPIK